MKIKPKKSLGQNFLSDKNIIEKIAEIEKISNKSSVLEIGPGTGNLTESILKKKPKNFIVIEKDYNLSKLLDKKFHDKIKIINEDFLNLNYKNISIDKLIIYGNLPYNVSTEILIRFITENEKFKSFKKLIFMFQKEVAERIIAKINSKKYGRLSVIANWRLNIKKEFDISPNSFFPIPKVNSTLLTFSPKKNIFISQTLKILKKSLEFFLIKEEK